jgi:hypothetical protein
VRGDERSVGSEGDEGRESSPTVVLGEVIGLDDGVVTKGSGVKLFTGAQVGE